ncbi:hypothetical protein QE152_g39280 [Popillia japonica]|uniref:Uncharacterized protein n=1 Tax=Popillia japonica TaxID=7064 RepID=A0AAW1HV05_POPJA
MSQCKRKMTHAQLHKLADNFGEISDEDNGEPFARTDSDESFQYESESETSSDSETVENIQTLTGIYEQESPKLIPLPAKGSQANQDPLWEHNLLQSRTLHQTPVCMLGVPPQSLKLDSFSD